jgi:hypothetical protein
LNDFLLLFVITDLLLPSPAKKNKISKNAEEGEIFFPQLLIQGKLLSKKFTVPLHKSFSFLNLVFDD